MIKFDHNIGFWEKRRFFRRKLAKIAENCDHNIDPRTPGDRKVFRAVPFVMAGQVGVAHGFELLRGDGHIAADDRLRVPVVTDFLNYFNNRFVSLSETRSCI
jgi:hypothetical protein